MGKFHYTSLGAYTASEAATSCGSMHSSPGMVACIDTWCLLVCTLLFVTDGRQPQGAAVDSARQNLASTFVNGFVNAGFGQDKLVTVSSESSSGSSEGEKL